jgi:hypothetical protein
LAGEDVCLVAKVLVGYALSLQAANTGEGADGVREGRLVGVKS